MTRSEAQQHCRELNEAAPEPGVRWMAREAAPGEWKAVRLKVPGMPAGMKRIVTSKDAEPGAPPAPDPRPLTNPFWGGP